MDFRPARHFGGKGPAPHQFERTLRGIALDLEGRLHAVGDSAVKVFDAKGALLRQWATGRPGECVAVDGEGRVWVGEREQVEVFDSRGELADTRRDPGRLGLVTAIGFGDGDVFLADATARWIRRYDAEARFLNNIGDQHRKGRVPHPQRRRRLRRRHRGGPPRREPRDAPGGALLPGRNAARAVRPLRRTRPRGFRGVLQPDEPDGRRPGSGATVPTSRTRSTSTCARGATCASRSARTPRWR